MDATAWRGHDAVIIVPARIIAVADDIESKCHHRPFRAALGLHAVLNEVTRGLRFLFDRDIVESCAAVFERRFEFESMVTAPVLSGIWNEDRATRVFSSEGCRGRTVRGTIAVIRF